MTSPRSFAGVVGAADPPLVYVGKQPTKSWRRDCRAAVAPLNGSHSSSTPTEQTQCSEAGGEKRKRIRKWRRAHRNACDRTVEPCEIILRITEGEVGVWHYPLRDGAPYLFESDR
jgi:hypothetical protein